MLQYSQLLQIIVLFFLAAASISDIRKREVPNWVNYGLIITGLGFSLLQSIVAADWRFLLFSAAGALSALVLAALMFYTGQWGGGDSKLLIGMGALLGLPLTTKMPFVSFNSPPISFLINLVIVSMFYAVAIGAFLAVKNKKRFAAEVARQLDNYSVARKLLLFLAAAGLVTVLAVNHFLIRLGVVSMLATLFFGFYLSIFAKAVEKACMLKLVSPLKLTEGDWIAKDVIVDGKRICGPKDLGVEKHHIQKLIMLYRKRRLNAVLIKEGIPFAPSFLIAYVITVFFGNLFFAFVR